MVVVVVVECCWQMACAKISRKRKKKSLKTKSNIHEKSDEYLLLLVVLDLRWVDWLVC